MNDNSAPDPNRKWRRAWRIFHSPAVLLPAVMTSTAAAAVEVAQVVPRFGWATGALLAGLLAVGMLISIVDLLPHLVRWLCNGQAQVSAALARAGRSLQVLSERITNIISDR